MRKVHFEIKDKRPFTKVYEYEEKLGFYRLKFINKFRYWQNSYKYGAEYDGQTKSFDFTHEKIAKALGCSLRWAKELTKYYTDKGNLRIVQRRNRYGKSANFYTWSDGESFCGCVSNYVSNALITMLVTTSCSALTAPHVVHSLHYSYLCKATLYEAPQASLYITTIRLKKEEEKKNEASSLISASSFLREEEVSNAYIIRLLKETSQTPIRKI